jgi:fibronectin type 3 domain-containing protein
LATGGEVEDYRITILASLFAPTVPTGLKINSTSETSVNISWNASTDNIGVTGYRIYRGGTFLGTSTVLSYTDNTVSAGNSYTYSVSATDGDGNESAQSTPVTAAIFDITAPSVPSGLTVTSASVNSIGLSWEVSTDNVGVSGYRIYRGGTILTSTSGLAYTDNTVSVSNSYSYTILAYDAAGNESDQSSAVSASTNDTSSPSVPAGLKVTSASVSSVSISWNSSTDNVGVTGYRIYRGGTILESTSDLTYTDNTVSAGNTYSYTVLAYDAAGNESTQSSAVTASTNDTEAPAVPAGLQVTSVSVASVSISWNASSDNIGVTGYRVYRDASILETTSDLAYTDNTVSVGNSYLYSVSAIDAAGNESVQSSGVTANTDDIDPPTVPTGLNANSPSENSISLSWNSSSDNVGVTGYRIYREGTLLGTAPALTYTDNTVSIGNIYTYAISAIDEAGNESALSLELKVSLNDTIPPTVPTGLKANSASESGLHLTWEASTDNIEVSGYNLYRGGVLLTKVNDLSCIDKGILPGSTYSYSVSATDFAGNESLPCEPVTVSISSTEFILVSELSVYPNPSDGEFVIEINETSGKFTLEIISSPGSITVQSVIYPDGSKLIFNYDFLNTGIYFIRLYNKDRLYYGKIVIQK